MRLLKDQPLCSPSSTYYVTFESNNQMITLTSVIIGLQTMRELVSNLTQLSTFVSFQNNFPYIPHTLLSMETNFFSIPAGI